MQPVKKTQQKILAAARRIARERRYEEIEMQDVAAAAEVSRATLYRYYATREQLYADLILEWGLAFHERLRNAADAPKEARSRVHWVLRSVLDEAERERRLIRAFLFAVLHGDASMAEPVAEIRLLLPSLLFLAMGEPAAALPAREVRLLQHVLLSSLVSLQRGDLDAATVAADLEHAADRLLFETGSPPSDEKRKAPPTPRRP